MKSKLTSLAPDFFISQLPPLKRILCICPVEEVSVVVENNTRSRNTVMNHHHHEQKFFPKTYSLSMAVSDPYLAYAIPLSPSSTTFTTQSLNHHNYSVHPNHLRNHWTMNCVRHSSVDNDKTYIRWSDEFPCTYEMFQNEIIQMNDEYSDIGGILFTLPITQRRRGWKKSDNDDYDNHNNHTSSVEEEDIEQYPKSFKLIHQAICNSLIERFLSSKKDAIHSKNTSIDASLVCYSYYAENIDYNEAIQLAKEEPEMWEYVVVDDLHLLNNNLCDLEDGRITESQYVQQKKYNFTSLHAATALNMFLWKYTGGWRNTFA